MNRQQELPSRPEWAVSAWTAARARAASPYIASILRSCREHWLESRFQQSSGDEIAAAHSDDLYRESLHELLEMNVGLRDPVRGQALLPFVHGRKLAWYLFDLFDPEPLRFWRLYDDPEGTRRPVAELAA